MKRKWIIPLVLCAVLLVAWPFRWDQGPTQTDEKLKILHLRDRWTGQAWIKTYGESGGKFYSGNMLPVIPPNEVEERKTQLLLAPEQIHYKQDLEKKISDYEKERDLHSEGYNEYQRLIKLVPMRGFDFSGLSSLETLATIPKNIANEYKSWNDANGVIWKATKDIESQQKQAEDRAQSELKTWAWQERNIATAVWVILLALAALATIISFRREAAVKIQHKDG